MGLPNNSMSVRCPWGNIEISVERAVAMLLRRVSRGEEKRGQWRKKCSVDSESREQRQVGLEQLNLWLNLCSRRSLKFTLNRVNRGRPIRSRMPNTFDLVGRMFFKKEVLKERRESESFKAWSRDSHSLKQWGKELR